jgi:hypothetical protein
MGACKGDWCLTRIDGRLRLTWLSTWLTLATALTNSAHHLKARDIHLQARPYPAVLVGKPTDAAPALDVDPLAGLQILGHGLDQRSERMTQADTAAAWAELDDRNAFLFEHLARLALGQPPSGGERHSRNGTQIVGEVRNGSASPKCPLTFGPASCRRMRAPMHPQATSVAAAQNEWLHGQFGRVGSKLTVTPTRRARRVLP